MVGPRLLVLKRRFYWEAVIGDGPHVLRPAVAFLNAGEPTADALLQQRLGDCALKNTHTIAQRLILPGVAWWSQTEVPRIALMHRVPGVHCSLGKLLKFLLPLRRGRHIAQLTLRIACPTPVHICPLPNSALCVPTTTSHHGGPKYIHVRYSTTQSYTLKPTDSLGRFLIDFPSQHRVSHRTASRRSR